MTACGPGPAGSSPCALPSGHDRLSAGRRLPVVVAVEDLLTLFEHVIFRLVVGNRGRCRRLLAVLGVVVGVLILGVAAGARCHGCEFCVPVSGTQNRWSSQASGSPLPRDPPLGGTCRVAWRPAWLSPDVHSVRLGHIRCRWVLW